MKKTEIDKLYEETGIYAWHDTDNKIVMSDMSVEFYFPATTDVEDAMTQIYKALEKSDLSYNMKTWTMPNSEHFEDIDD
tara:strand:- start:7101 stop:7337 length:237 start_codon:yes stop_codon:yes gene_type:complete